MGLAFWAGLQPFKTAMPFLVGEGACPPENVGGLPGYAPFIKALGDASLSEHKTYVDWVGGVWGVKGLDLNCVNRKLMQVLKSN
jgi:hypothetical protein